ncbi:MAG: hypothetical protein DRP29_06170 [Thermodesulfobacteriota bacterium]|nr:MAG: hypothetical protein DRP29_06170 [Thermodesulfobacteriota bacterium]
MAENKKVYDFNKIQPLVIEKKEYKQWEGDKISIEELENKVVVVVDFEKMPSKSEYKAQTPFYASIQMISADNKKFWTTTSSSVLLETLEASKSQMPYKVMLTKEKSKRGRRYWVFKSVE